MAAVSTRVDDAVGWRGAFQVAGASSLVVALVAFLLLPAEVGPPLDAETKDLEEGGFGGVFFSRRHDGRWRRRRADLVRVQIQKLIELNLGSVLLPDHDHLAAAALPE